MRAMAIEVVAPGASPQKIEKAVVVSQDKQT